LDYLVAAFERKRQGAGPTWAELLKEVREKFRLEWNDSSLSRYYGYWRSTLYVEDRAREEATAIVGRLREHPTPELEAAVKQLLLQQRMLALTRLDGADPVDIIHAGLAQDRVGVERDKVDLQRQKLDIERGLADLERRKVELREKAAEVVNRVEEKAKAVGKTLDPEVARMIREEVYGLPG
jgi:vacuolar-type H+-ATPase subunit I/STV1